MKNDELKTLCICGGPTYECARCYEKRCMTCDEVSTREEIKTAVRWCPEHRADGVLGRLEAGVRP